MAESEARLAIGLLAIDNSGPAEAEIEFAASVMRQLRRPIRLCSRQMSRRKTVTKSPRTPPVRSHIARGRFAGWSIFASTLQLPQSVSVECPPKRQKLRLRVLWRDIMLVSCSTNPKNNITKYHDSYVLVPARTAVKSFYLSISCGKHHIQPSATTFSNFGDNVAVLRRHEKRCRFSTLW